MRVLVNNTYDSDVLECPEEIADKLIAYQEEFDRWTVACDQINDLEHLMEYINERYLKSKGQRIHIVERGIFPTKEQKKQMPHINY